MKENSKEFSFSLENYENSALEPLAWNWHADPVQMKSLLPRPPLGVAELAASTETIKKSLTCAKGGIITWALAFYEIGKVDFSS